MAEEDTEKELLINTVRVWLIKKPHPVLIRVVSKAGEEHDVKPPPRPRWRSVAETIVSLDPKSMHALDAVGSILRAEDVDSKDAVAASDGMVTPVGLDAESQRFMLVAKLLAGAHEKSNEFVKEFAKILMDRTDQMEARLERSEENYRMEYLARVQADMKNVDPSDAKDEIMSQFFSNYMGGKKERETAEAAAAPTNGASPARPRGWGPDGGDG